ncbi:MAG: carbohydrate binding domain-containing protein, partial [Candidatus Fimadaptatus sp.]
MNKRWVQVLMLVALALCVSLMPTGALGDAEGENLLANAGFEELDGTGMPVGWARSMYNWDDGVTAFDVVTGTAHTGSACVRVRSLGENDARFEQTVACEPNTVYRLSGWVRVEDVPEGTMGANLSVEDAFSSTNSVTGTSAEGEWTYIELYGITGPEQTSLTVMARLGFYGSTITGTAWFDDIALEHVHEIPDGAMFGYLYQDTGDSGATEAAPRDYTAYLIALALAFALVVLALLMLRDRQRLPSLSAENHEQAVLWAMLAVAFVARLVLAALVPGYPNDIACWQGWGARVIEEGTWGFYESGWCDYPPGYMYVLGALDALRTLVGAQYNTALSQTIVKLPAMLCDLAGALLLYRWARREGTQGGMALWLAALYAFNPLTICDSAAWGQIDSVFTLMVAVAVYFCVKGRWTVALPVYVVSALVKPQTLMLAPMALVVLITELVRAARDGELGRTLKQVGMGLAISLAAAVVIVVPFWGGQSWDWLVSKYVGTMASYSYATVNALNLYAIAGLNWTEVSASIAGIPAAYLGYAFMALSVAYCAFLYIRARDRRAMPLACALMIMLLFCFGTMMHERYAFPALLLMLLGYVLLKDRRLLTAAAIMSASQFMNVALVLQSEHLQSSQWLINDIVALCNIAVTVYACVFAFDICVRGHICAFGAAGSTRRARIAPEGFPSVREDMMRRLTGRSEYRLGMKALDWALVGVLTAAYAVLAFTNLGTLSAPQTEWRSTMPGETVTIDLGEERTFDFTYYGGICDSAFTVEFSSDGVTWSEPGQAEYRQ